MKKFLAAPLALAVMLATTPAFAALGCKDAFEQVLATYGIKLTDLKEMQDYKVGRDSPSVVIEGRPPQCESGDVVVSMWYTCTLQNIYTTGGCRVPGIPSSPL